VTPHLDAPALRRLLQAPDPVAELPAEDLIPAAVLVGLVTGPAPGVLLTKRTAHLRTHSGQVSFPGGRIDPEDSGPEAAALREAREEVGLDPDRIEILGRLRDFVTGTGYRITPVLALLQPGFAVDPSPHEVAAVFQLPLAVLLDPQAPRRRSQMFAGSPREFWVWPHPEHEIWGATAAILVHLATRLRSDPGLNRLAQPS
jgi:8-oxo-dGTP pyrophosphatase MutT (NUDIX family)